MTALSTPPAAPAAPPDLAGVAVLRRGSVTEVRAPAYTLPVDVEAVSRVPCAAVAACGRRYRQERRR